MRNRAHKPRQGWDANRYLFETKSSFRCCWQDVWSFVLVRHFHNTVAATSWYWCILCTQKRPTTCLCAQFLALAIHWRESLAAKTNTAALGSAFELLSTPRWRAHMHTHTGTGTRARTHTRNTSISRATLSFSRAPSIRRVHPVPKGLSVIERISWIFALTCSELYYPCTWRVGSGGEVKGRGWRGSGISWERWRKGLIGICTCAPHAQAQTNTCTWQVDWRVHTHSGVPEAKMLRPPAFDTAATNLGSEIQDIPGRMIGCLILNNFCTVHRSQHLSVLVSLR